MRLFLAFALCLSSALGQNLEQSCEGQSCDGEDISDQSSLLALRTGLISKAAVEQKAGGPEEHGLFEAMKESLKAKSEEIAKSEEMNKGIAPAVRKSSPPKQRKTCAVCFTGELRNVNVTRDNLRRNLLDALTLDGVDVDVFVAAPKKGPWTITDLGLPFDSDGNNDGPHRIAIRDFRYKPEPTPKEMQDSITNSAPAKAVELYRGDKLKLGPAFGHDSNELRVYNHKAECAEMIEKWELRHNMRYDWLMGTRPDFMWLSPHPPLSLMNADMLWMFDTEQYEAINNRHNFGGHDIMMYAIFGAMKVLKTGDPVIYSPCKYNMLADEWFTKLLADSKKTHVGQMPTIAYLGHCPSWSTHCTRSDHVGLYTPEVKHAKDNQIRFEQTGSCWAQTAYDRVNITSKCSNGFALEHSQ